MCYNVILHAHTYHSYFIVVLYSNMAKELQSISLDRNV